MTRQAVTRRELIATAASAGVAAMLLAACSDDRRFADVDKLDPEFARPWADLRSNEVVQLGEEVLRIDPGAVSHARSRLAASTASTDAQQTLATAVDADTAARLMSDVGDWLLPRTLAGLAGGLALLA